MLGPYCGGTCFGWLSCSQGSQSWWCFQLNVRAILECVFTIMQRFAQEAIQKNQGKRQNDTTVSGIKRHLLVGTMFTYNQWLRNLIIHFCASLTGAARPIDDVPEASSGHIHSASDDPQLSHGLPGGCRIAINCEAAGRSRCQCRDTLVRCQSHPPTDCSITGIEELDKFWLSVRLRGA